MINDPATGWLQALQGNTTIANTVANVIGSSTVELTELIQLVNDGVDVSVRLSQLNLSTTALAYLAKVISSPAPTQDELDTFDDIVL